LECHYLYYFGWYVLDYLENFLEKTTGKMGAIINASIELTKIDKSKVFEKDGRKYLSVTIAINDETQFGNNVGISHNQSKEERDAKDKKVFIGNGKVVWTDGVIKLAEKEGEQPQVSGEIVDDLPF